MEFTNQILNESSYIIDVYYDALYDDFCLTTRYRFITKELVEEFIKHNEYINNLLFNEKINFEIQRSIISYDKKDLLRPEKDLLRPEKDLLRLEKEKDKYRPRFSDLTTANDDLQQFIKCCCNYWNDESYQYKSNIAEEPLNDLIMAYLRKENDKLKTDNEKLKAKCDELKAKCDELLNVIN